MRKHQQHSLIYVASILLLLMGQDVRTQTLLQKLDLVPLSNDSLHSLATNYYAFDTKTADFICDYLIERALSSKNTTELYDAYHQKAFNYEKQQWYSEAFHYDSLSAELVKDSDLHTYSYTLIDMAIVQRKLQNFPRSRTIYLTVLELSKKNKDIENQQNALCGLGILYDAAGNMDNAINYFKEALALAEASSDSAKCIVYLNNLAEEFSKNKQYNEALANIERASNIAKTTNDYDSKIYIGQQYAQALADLGRFEEALMKIEETLAQCQGFSIRRDINTLSIVKGDIFLKQRNMNAAVAIFLECLARPMNVTHQATVNYELGKIYQDRGEIAKAKPYLIKAQALAEQNQLLGYDEKSHRALYAVYVAEKNSTKALYHLEKANALRDQYFNFEKSAKVSELLFRYDLAQGEQKIKEVELQASRNLMLAGGILSLLLIVSLVYIMYLRSGTYNVLKVKSEKIEQQKAELEIANEAMARKKEELEVQARLLEESNGLLRQFSYAVAHDLKEPLRTMSSFIKIINRRYAPLLPSDSKEYFDFVISGADRMTKMLEGLLRYSMMSMNKKMEVEAFSLSDVVKEVTNSLYVTINERQAKIIFNDTMPMVCMNRLHTVQLVQNLVSNALKFVEQSPVIEIQSHVNEAGQVLFSIKDNGIGIDKDSGGKLFQLFHRVHRDTTRFEGTGVGLALCKSIVEKYNGQIWFESEKDQGTKFFMSLPKAA